MCVCVFFFQAEDGIRDLVRSRGLGDGYKRQPMTMEESDPSGQNHHVFSYEPDGAEILNQIVPRFTAIQIYQSILSSQASEHAARMVSMRNATDNALELIGFLQLQYNKARQQSITSDMLDIVGGAEAQASS